MTALAPITSRLVTGPMSALATATPLCDSIDTTASSEPIVSHRTVTPSASVSTNTERISASILPRSSATAAAAAPAGATSIVDPGRTPSRSGDAILTPAAAETDSTGANRSRGSRISSSGLGSSMALGLAATTPPRLAATTVSPMDSVPSASMTLADGPIPTSSLTSSTMPRASPPASWSRRAARYCCVRPTRTASSSGTPVPERALVGTMHTSRAKSLTRSNDSDLYPRTDRDPTISYSFWSRSARTDSSCAPTASAAEA